MSANIYFLLVASVIALLVLVAWIVRVRSCQQGEAWMPRELRNAELVYAEELFRSGGDVPIVAKCDRGYRTKKGIIVLVELKTRKLNRVYLSDIVELSAQRYAIQMQTAEVVAEYAYVLIQRTATKAQDRHRVKLLPPDGILSLALRRRDILTGTVAANFAYSTGLCRNCSFAKECNKY